MSIELHNNNSFDSYQCGDGTESVLIIKLHNNNPFDSCDLYILYMCGR